MKKYGSKINFVWFYGDVLCVAAFLVFYLTLCERGTWEAVFQTTAEHELDQHENAEANGIGQLQRFSSLHIN